MPAPSRKRGSTRRDGDDEDKLGSSALTRHIATAITVSDADFVDRYMQPRPGWKLWTHPRSGDKYTLSLTSVGYMSDADLEACFDLIEATSGADYRASSAGWHPAKKKEEMRSPELRYLMVRADKEGGQGNSKGAASAQEAKGSASRIRGFTSMMPTFENGEPVVYCYEIHLRPELQGTGMGRLLMEHVHAVATSIPGVEKTMLTCFVSNSRGTRFYNKLGFEMDDSSPRDRKLRGGKVIKADYMILARDASSAESSKDG